MDVEDSSFRFESPIHAEMAPAPGSIALSPDYSGMDIVVKSAVRAAHSAVLGNGGAQNIHPATISNMASTVSRLLEARNLAEQLKVAGIYTKYTSILTETSLSLLEPVVKAYRYYGDFFNEGKHYAARACDDRFAAALIKLCAQTHYEQLNNERRVTMEQEDLSKIDLNWYTIGPSGDLVYRGRTLPLRERILNLIKFIGNIQEIGIDQRIAYIRSATDICDEADLRSFTYLLVSKGYSFKEELNQWPTAGDHKAHAQALLGQTSFSEETVIASDRVVAKITVAFSVCRHVTSLLSLRMRSSPVLQYRGGRPAQLAFLEGPVLYSEVPLSPDDLTMAMACSMSVGAAMRFRTCPAEDRDNLIRRLVMQSMT